LCGTPTLNPNGDSNSHNETDNNTNNPIEVKKQIRQICSINEFQTIARGKHGLCTKHLRETSSSHIPTLPPATKVRNKIQAIERKKKLITYTPDT